jgi:hypothetical protein
MDDVPELLKKLSQECPLIPFTHASRLSSTVRRMKREKELKIPAEHRTGFAISVEHGSRAHDLAEAEWDKLYAALSQELLQNYPSLSPHSVGKPTDVSKTGETDPSSC